MSVDHYVYLGTNVLVNRFGITDAGKLSIVERTYTADEIVDLRSEGVTGCFDAQHLKSIHGRIFGGIYDWAGEFRDIDIWKGGTRFTDPDRIQPALEELSVRIAGLDYFRGMSHDDTANTLADTMAALDQIHPFREGNGRTQRMFIGQLALNAGYDLDFIVMSENEMRNVSMSVARGNMNLIRYLFRTAMSDRIYDMGPVARDAVGVIGSASRKTTTFARLIAMLGRGRQDCDDGLDCPGM